MRVGNEPVEINDTDIAIVGMAAHLPGAASVEEFWANLQAGISAIREYSEAELIKAGESPARLHHKNYVPFAAPLDGFDQFDAEFFGFSPKEAAIMDPQHRQFLEVAWEALENAGHPPEKFSGPIGAFGGCGMGSYFYFNICSNPDLVDDVGMFLLRHTGNDKDFLTTRLSHVLDLKGPSITLQTACSTSLVATHYAVQALLNGECDMALAGGVTIELPQGRGYVFEDGEILSPDGQCHAFDHRAEGTVFGSGAGVVVLRRLGDAIKDGDHIWGVIKGTAINNDGAAKAGYLAPSVDGQAAAIAEAQVISGVTADSIGYVECHGTGTFLGDPIEVAALTTAFRQTTDTTGFCRIGSVKTNIGHLDTAAGVASLIKTSLSLYHGKIPPSLGFEKPNPSIDFANSPFVVNDTLTDWGSEGGPRRAGVNSLGVGGTNAHAVLQEPPLRDPSEVSDWPFHLLTISGRSRAALDANAAALAAHLRAHPEQPLADIAFTLQEGRRTFEKRRVLVATSHAAAADLLDGKNARRVFDHSPAGADPDVVFMFPGGGAQFAGMARELYETEPVFQEWMDRGFELLEPKLDYDIRALWLPDEDARATADLRLKQPSVQLPLILIVEYALAQLWMSWGITPKALIGHSMGENTAACLAGVMSFEDCIGLVLLRGQLFDTMPAGGMLSVPMALTDLREHLGDNLDIAGINASNLTVVSGPQADLDALSKTLAKQQVDCIRIPIDIAAHSRMLDAILDDFRAYLQGITLNPPKIPLISNRSGDWITDAQATDPDYWVSHLRGTVHFSDGISTLANQSADRIYLEVGPGKALASLVRMHGAVPGQQALSSLRHPDDEIADDIYFLETLGRLSALGLAIDWHQIWGEAKRHRVPLPSYAFQRSKYFIEPGKATAPATTAHLSKIKDLTNWGYRPVWTPQYAACEIDVRTELEQADTHTWLILVDQDGLGTVVASRLRAAGHFVVELRAGDRFLRQSDRDYILAPERGRQGYDQLVQDLVADGHAPDRIVSFWQSGNRVDYRPGSSLLHRNLEQGFYSLLFLAQAITDENLPTPLHITTVSSGAVCVAAEPLNQPEKATILGPVRVIPRELPGVTASLLDVEIPEPAPTGFFKRKDSPNADLDLLADQVLEELMTPSTNQIAAIRQGKRLVSATRPLKLNDKDSPERPTYRTGGTYLITGGFGGIGLTLAEEMLKTASANVVLIGRSELPARQNWPTYLRQHEPNDHISTKIHALKRLEELDGTITALTADICNIDEMRRAVDTVRAQFGDINGVVHAAGVIDDAPLLAKSPTSIEAVFTPKIHGTQVLHDLFPDGALDWLVLFSSTSTLTAPAGQIDYVAANEYLNAYANSRSSDQTRVLSINWGIWAKVGMAATALAKRQDTTPPVEFSPTTQPLLDQQGFDRDGNRLFTTDLTPASHWVLKEHRTRDGAAILPGTAYLELASQALQAHGEDGGFEIHDLVFLRPLGVDDDTTTTLQVQLQRSDEGYKFVVRSGHDLAGRKGFVLNAEARLLMTEPNPVKPLDIQAIRSRCKKRKVADNQSTLISPQEAHLNFGPRWRVLRETCFGTGEGLAKLALPLAFRGDLKDGYRLHPALLDLATGWAMELIKGYQPTHLWVPLSYDRIEVQRPLPAEVYSWARLGDANETDASMARFDVLICDAKGNICVKVTGFSIKRLDQAMALSNAPKPRPSEIHFPDDIAQTQPLSAAEERLAYNLSQGISPKEGVAAFGRALATGLPRVIVSSLDLPGLIAEEGANPANAQSSTAKFQRPALETDYVAPRNDFERTLAGFWQELLGVEQVGIEDNFFDLGGHSLIAVRLFMMVKKAYRVEFPISVLFEAPTIAKCAGMIAEQVGPPVETDGATTGQVAKPARRYSYLVPMHDGEGGTKTPFFLVAGMFGNVLNLRHLAQLIGADRPFFGLQARGLYGAQEPHNSIVRAATDYIAEMRSVQPQGPYLLGGFSGGGITAYEIAQQLEAAGEKVALLVMLDTPLPVRTPLSGKDRALIQMQQIRHKGPAYVTEWIGNRIRWEIAKRRGAGSDGAVKNSFNNSAIEAAFLQAVAAYPIQPWSGRLLLLRPPQIGQWRVSGGGWVDDQRAYLLEDNGWGALVTNPEITEVPGTHDSMVLEPNVRVLAADMQAAIKAAETQIDRDKNWPFNQAAE